MNDKIFGLKLVEAVGLLKVIKKKNEEENLEIDAFMAQLVEDLGEDLKSKEGEKSSSPDVGMDAMKFLKLLNEMEKTVKEREEKSKKAVPPVSIPSGLGEVVGELVSTPSSTPTLTTETATTIGSSGTKPFEGIMQMKNYTPEEIPPEKLVPKLQVWCAVCNEYHNAGSDPDAHDSDLLGLTS